MKWIAGLIAFVITFIVSWMMVFNTGWDYVHGVDYYAWAFESLVISLIIGFIGFGVVVWGIGISEANAQAAANEAGMEDIQSADENLEAETTTEANPVEMGTCIYCGREIDEETAICDDCLKGQQSKLA